MITATWQAVAKVALVALCAVALLSAGCWHDAQREPDPVQDIVRAKLDEQRTERSGVARWDDHRSADYNRREDIPHDREQIAIDERRRAVADALTEGGALGLADCMAFSLEFNERIQSRREAIRAVQGEEVVARSRFLPHLVYRLDHEAVRRQIEEEEEDEEFVLPPLPSPPATPTVTSKEPPMLGASGGGSGGSGEEDEEEPEREKRWRRSTDHVLLLTQTLLEFGKDNPEDVAVRQAQRNALFDYEDAVRDVLRDVRLRFFTILLRHRQLEERGKLLAEFEERYRQIVVMAEERRVPESDVLTARLNVLNEKSNINKLEHEILRQNIDLSRQMGLPVGMTDFELRGEHETFDLPLEEAVDIAARRSTGIAETRAELWEQERVVREMIWEYAPDLGLQVGWRDRTATAGVELANNENDTFGLGLFGEKQLDGAPANGFVTDNVILTADEQGWFVGVFAELTLMDGSERKGRLMTEKAVLEQRRHNLKSAVYAVDSDVRKAYQVVLERRRELEILSETVRIAKDRLWVQERKKELGKVTDADLEPFRRQFFADQDAFFRQQIELIAAQEDLRSAMRYFEPLSERGD